MTSPKNIILPLRSKVLGWLPLIVLVTVSAAIIFYQFPAIPQNLSFDEVEFAKLALSLKNQPYTPYSQLATGHATLYFYFILLSFQLFGITAFALRLPAALFGLINTVLFYFILKLFLSIKMDKRNGWHEGGVPASAQERALVGRTASDGIRKDKSTFKFYTLMPFLLAITFTSLRWYFHFARFSFEVTFLLFLEFISILSLFTLFKSNKKKFLIIAGLFAGLAYNSYLPGRIFVLLPLFTLIFYKINSGTGGRKEGIPTARNGVSTEHWREGISGGIWKQKLILITLFIIPFILAVLPLQIYLSQPQHQDTRVYQQFYPVNFSLPVETRQQFFMNNLTNNILMFHVKGDVNGRHNYPGKPILNPIMGALFIIGLIISIKNIKKFPNQFFLVYFILGFIPTLVTYPWENPNMLRIFTTIPAVVYFIGQSLLLILHIPKIKKQLLLAFCCLLICISIFYELRTYFVFQTQVFPLSFEMRGELEKLVKLKP